VVAFSYDGSGRSRRGTCIISADDRLIARGRIDRTIPRPVLLAEGLDIGEDTGCPYRKLRPAVLVVQATEDGY
jgi:hypothetical protein